MLSTLLLKLISRTDALSRLFESGLGLLSRKHTLVAQSRCCHSWSQLGKSLLRRSQPEIWLFLTAKLLCAHATCTAGPQQSKRETAWNIIGLFCCQSVPRRGSGLGLAESCSQPPHAGAVSTHSLPAARWALLLRQALDVQPVQIILCSCLAQGHGRVSCP